ncbi:MAG: hypothetical protein WC394_05035, partial [Candidatus Omnitrophota bacterium]
PEDLVLKVIATYVIRAEKIRGEPVLTPPFSLERLGELDECDLERQRMNAFYFAYEVCRLAVEFLRRQGVFDSGTDLPSYTLPSGSVFENMFEGSSPLGMESQDRVYRSNRSNVLLVGGAGFNLKQASEVLNRSQFSSSPAKGSPAVDPNIIAKYKKRAEKIRRGKVTAERAQQQQRDSCFETVEDMIDAELKSLDTGHLSAQEQERLALSAQQGMREDADKLIISSPRRVKVIADAFYRRHPGIPRAEFFEYGVLGLIKAVYGFKPQTPSKKRPGDKTRFINYATICIVNAIKAGLHEQGQGLAIPSDVIFKYLRKILQYCKEKEINAFKATGEQVIEIAAEVGTNPEIVISLLRHLRVVPLAGSVTSGMDQDEDTSMDTVIDAYESIKRHEGYLSSLSAQERAQVFAELVTEQAFVKEMKKFRDNLLYRLIITQRIWPMLLGVNREEPLKIEDIAERDYLYEPLAEEAPESAKKNGVSLSTRKDALRQIEKSCLDLLCKTIMRLEKEGRLVDFDLMGRAVVFAIIAKRIIHYFQNSIELGLSARARARRMERIKLVLEMIILPKVGIGIATHTPFQIIRVIKARRAGVPVTSICKLHNDDSIESLFGKDGKPVDLSVSTEEIAELSDLEYQCIDRCRSIVEDGIGAHWYSFLKFSGILDKPKDAAVDVKLAARPEVPVERFSLLELDGEYREAGITLEESFRGLDGRTLSAILEELNVPEMTMLKVLAYYKDGESLEQVAEGYRCSPEDVSSELKCLLLTLISRGEDRRFINVSSPAVSQGRNNVRVLSQYHPLAVKAQKIISGVFIVMALPFAIFSALAPFMPIPEELALAIMKIVAYYILSPSLILLILADFGDRLVETIVSNFAEKEAGQDHEEAVKDWLLSEPRVENLFNIDFPVRYLGRDDMKARLKLLLRQTINACERMREETRALGLSQKLVRHICVVLGHFIDNAFDAVFIRADEEGSGVIIEKPIVFQARYDEQNQELNFIIIDHGNG